MEDVWWKINQDEGNEKYNTAGICSSVFQSESMKGDRSMTSLNGYPVRGILEQFKTGLLDLNKTEDVINIYIQTSRKKGYSEGVVDSLRYRSERVQVRTRVDLTPLGISVRSYEFQSLRSALIDKEV